jgi:hypothetical protein
MFDPRFADWRIQYERMMRGFARLQHDYKSSVEYGDDLQHFLQDCWHLKDWIKNDPKLSVGKQIEKEVEAYRPLMITADLANACKHVNHDKHDRTGAYVTRNDLTVGLGQDRPIEVVHYIETDDGKTITAQELIHEVIGAWGQLLHKLGLM